jgi:hypothetical protein
MSRRRVLTIDRATIDNGSLIKALRRGGAVHRCVNCGERMFVKYASGLCPLCYNGRRAVQVDEPVHVVSDEKVLAGVIDDPAIEVVPEQAGDAPSK